LLDQTLLLLFIPTFFLVSLTPGMCMTLAMTLGMSVGVRQTMWMMWGELLGVATVSVSAVLGVSAILLAHPSIFNVLKLVGAAYLLWVAFNMWQSKGKMALSDNAQKTELSRWGLFNQGFITAISNPKGWAFTVSLLPPFINPELALAPQLSALVFIILCSEFICMMIYASGGKTIGKLLTEQNNVQKLNKISGGLMGGVAVWLAVS
jgi:threonine/homoserine/homoserine lactone efflux protein